VTATSLFDILARDVESGIGVGNQKQLFPLAEKMISVCLSDLGHLRGYEQDLSLTTVSGSKLELELRQTIWQLYKEWAAAADELYQRARLLQFRGVSVQGIDHLNDEIGRIQARLTVKPEQLVKARQQVRNGQIIPAKELRDELNAKLRG
jgi:hypothetical protein